MLTQSTNSPKLGAIAPNFKLLNIIDNQLLSLEQLKGNRGTIICFICNHCPYVKAIIGHLVDDAKKLLKDEVNTIAIMSNDYQNYTDDSPEKMKLFAKEHNFGFPYLLDETQEVANKYCAVCTPDFFGYNAKLELCYRGRIDETKVNFDSGKKRELLNAMRLIAKTGKGPSEQIPSIGCSIKWRA